MTRACRGVGRSDRPVLMNPTPPGMARRVRLAALVRHVIEPRPIVVKPLPRLRVIFDQVRERDMVAFLPSNLHDACRAGPHLCHDVLSVIRLGVCIAVIGLGSGVASARERQAGLAAYDIFSESTPRPQRPIPGSGPKLDHTVTTAQSKPPRINAPAAHIVGQVAIHPTASMFPPVAPLE
jgi:hypothetical protein